MRTTRKRWPTVRDAVEGLYGRVWTDLEELKPWVVLLRQPDGIVQEGSSPTLVFRAGTEEFHLSVNQDIHLEDLDDGILRGYLHLARGA